MFAFIVPPPKVLEFFLTILMLDKSALLVNPSTSWRASNSLGTLLEDILLFLSPKSLTLFCSPSEFIFSLVLNNLIHIIQVY